MLLKRNIKIFSTFTTKKAAIAERFNRSLKNLMWKHFSHSGGHKWIKMLHKLIDQYNNTFHRTIKMKPIDVNRSVERELLNTVYTPRITWKLKPKFKIGDHLRISKYKHIFYKGYTMNWTTEIFRIRKVQHTNPITYLLIDFYGQDINGSFYKEELQLVGDSKLYLVEKIIKSRGDGVYVKWLGFDSIHNSWIKKSSVLE